MEFRTRTSTDGLDEGFDLLVIDEAQEYTEDQESALKSYLQGMRALPELSACFSFGFSEFLTKFQGVDGYSMQTQDISTH